MGKPAARVRYNSKARGSTAGGSLKRGKPKKQHDPSGQSEGLTGATVVDSNADIILPPSKPEEDDRLQQRKEALKSEVRVNCLYLSVSWGPYAQFPASGHSGD